MKGRQRWHMIRIEVLPEAAGKEGVWCSSS